MRRLSEGGCIDRAKPIRFRFNGKVFEGFAGDTLASALLANGVQVVGRSFKYHRPRGFFTNSSAEPNGLATVDGAPNLQMTMVPIEEGMEAFSQNHWPSLDFDLLSLNGLLGPLLSAGFYYKTFMWPKAAWEKLYEPLIRKSAGLGTLPKAQKRVDTLVRHAHCDLLIVGAGPAGLQAAELAKAAGVDTIILDENSDFGGAGLGQTDSNVDRYEQLEALNCLKRTTLFGVYDHGQCGALEVRATGLQRYWKITARHILLATGASERPIAFPGNDRPGIQLSSAMRSYARKYGVVPRGPICVFTSTDFGWSVAREMQELGIEVAAVIDPRNAVNKSLSDTLDAPQYLNAVVTGAVGRKGLRAIDVRRADGKNQRMQCRSLALSGGWSPNVALASHLGHSPRWNEEIAAFVPGDTPSFISVCGSAAGHLDQGRCLDSVRTLMADILAKWDKQTDAVSNASKNLGSTSKEPIGHSPVWYVNGGKQKAFVDFQHDVTVSDIKQASREGFKASEHVKRYTTLGMASDQGRSGSVNGLAVLADMQNQSLQKVGLTKPRPPYSPVPISALAGGKQGKGFRPTRYTPSHSWASTNGAVFTDAGLWRRAQYFPRRGERTWRKTVDREVKTVRASVGFCDVSTLGKIEIFGRDAATFLDRLYVNNWQKLAVGKARYGLMLHEDGFAFDDGTTSRLGEEHYMMTTTTANAGGVMQHLRFAHQCLFPDFDVSFTSSTDQWAQFALAGPRSRAVLAKLVDIDVSNEAFPFMGVKPAKVCGVDGWLYRLSFSGELAYEIAVPAGYGNSLATALTVAGKDEDICPYGTEALGVLRVEKGHVAGPELNGQTTAHDLGMARMMSVKKDFIGRRMAEREALMSDERPRLVGLQACEPSSTFLAGAHLLEISAPRVAARDLGFVSSAVFSPHLGCQIGLGFLCGGDHRRGETLTAFDPIRKKETLVKVVTPHFVDPKGERLRA